MATGDLQVFISYRRDDARAYAGWLAYCLEESFGQENVFIDVDRIDPGVDFMVAIEKAIRRSDVVLPLIGPSWLTLTGSDGARRIDAPDDPVRHEIEVALGLKRRLIPVLFDAARMPASADLPESIRPMARVNAHRMSHEGWRADLASLDALLRNAAAAKSAGSKLTGADIVRRVESGEGPSWVGRTGGVNGKAFQDDVRSGRWAEQSYEVRFGGDVPSKNWFSVDEFMRAVHGSE
jgi:hypothetical protein